MKSHTVPQRLLEQFAYKDGRTNSLRLWRYEEGKAPYWKASPETATMIEGHFADPGDEAKEAELEERLAREYENPVNEFLVCLDDPSFLPSDLNLRQLTFYITLLFNRSKARRLATAELQKVSRHAFESFLSNDSRVATVVAKENIEILLDRSTRQTLTTKKDIVERVQRALRRSETELERQISYVQTIERAMADFDEPLGNGEWKFERASPATPFVISDAPVVTWVRLDSGQISYGHGFHSANVEVFLPISPSTCLHVMPAVARQRTVKQPTVQEINAAQAAFASRCCFANVNNSAVDRILQANFGKAELGVTAFTVWHKNYADKVYELFMKPGKWIEPPVR
jgi:hypothetical protein